MHEWLKQKALDISFPPDGYGVYVIWPENNRFIKIGLTREVRNRLADLQHAHVAETISPKLKEKFLRQRLSDTSCHMKGSDNY